MGVGLFFTEGGLTAPPDTADIGRAEMWSHDGRDHELPLSVAADGPAAHLVAADTRRAGSVVVRNPRHGERQVCGDLIRGGQWSCGGRGQPCGPRHGGHRAAE